MLSEILTHFLVCCFGTGSWIALNGLWVELPILVQDLPEKWQLGSYLAVIIQIANIGPICFTFGNVLFPKVVKEKHVAYIIIFTGTIASLLLVHFWDHTSYIAGYLHSTSLLIHTFFLSLVDCTSSVVFLPYMATFKERYLTTFYIGEGLSGLLPSIVALIQGAGDLKCVNVTKMMNITYNHTLDYNVTTDETHLQPKYLDPLFPVKDFFYFLFAMMLLCGISFTLLNNLKLCRLQYARINPVTPSLAPQSSEDGLLQSNTTLAPDNAANGSKNQTPTQYGVVNTSDRNCDEPTMSWFTFIYLLFLILVINALLNGILPSAQSYSCLPYGLKPYHYAVTLSSIANPLSCIFAFFIPTSLVSVITGLTYFGVCIAGYIIAVASASPIPPLVDHPAGAVLIVCAWVISTFIGTYAKVNIALLLRRHGRKALLWCGAVTQLGSAIGAILMFILVSVVKVFQSAPSC